MIGLLGAAADMQRVMTKLVIQLSLTDTASGLGQVQPQLAIAQLLVFFPCLAHRLQTSAQTYTDIGFAMPYPLRHLIERPFGHGLFLQEHRLHCHQCQNSSAQLVVPAAAAADAHADWHRVQDHFQGHD